jgi:SAM-dependent methyltransferase
MSRVIFKQSDYPVLQNRVYETYEEAINCPRGDICLMENSKTGLIYNQAFRSELICYDSSYNNEQSFSSSFYNHLKTVENIICENLGRDSLVEVGCGKGFFLEMLLANGFDITGFDPVYEGKNHRIIKELFRDGVLKPSKGLILRHVLEHVQDPFNFLCQLRDSNRGGLIYIEVPCFDWICKQKAWFDIYYEHVNYFRLSDFKKMFGRIIKVYRLFEGQHLGIVADLSTLRQPIKNDFDVVNFPDEFFHSLSIIKKRLGQYPVCVWGAASKGVIFSLLLSRLGVHIDSVIDINPSKQGKFIPVTGIKVQSAETALRNLPNESSIYITNPSYSDEIKKMSNYQFQYIIINNE